MTSYFEGTKHRPKNDKINHVMQKTRRTAGYTQEKLGKIVGRASVTISQYECGHLNPSHATAAKIAKTLKVEQYHIFPHISLTKNTRNDCKDPYINYAFREARHAAGLTVKELAKKATIPYATVFAYERIRAYPSEENANKIAKVLGIDRNDIFPAALREYTSEIRNERKKPKNPILSIEYRPTSDIKKLRLESDSNAEKDITEKEFEKKFAETLGALTLRERAIICMRYGLNGNRIQTQKYIGELFDISKGCVQQIQQKALRKLQHQSSNYKLEISL